MTEEQTLEALEKHFGTTVHGWPAIPLERARFWQFWLWKRDRQIDDALAAIGRTGFTAQMGRRYWRQVRYGQDICEDAGGYRWRCWCAALDLPFRAPTCTYSGYMAPGEDQEIGRAYIGVMKSLGGEGR